MRFTENRTSTSIDTKARLLIIRFRIHAEQGATIPMTSDIKLDGDNVIVEGTLHARGGSEIHSSGNLAGFAFVDREQGVRERFVWYSYQGFARLWCDTKGDVMAIHPPADRPISGRVSDAVRFMVSDIIVSKAGASDSGTNYALSHCNGDKLSINRGGGYKGGVEIDGEKGLVITGRVQTQSSSGASTQSSVDDAAITRAVLNAFPQKAPNWTMPSAGGLNSIAMDIPLVTSICITNKSITLNNGVSQVDLVAEVLRLRDEVAALKKKLGT
ncbi:hypothetical protein [Sorangium sp. So ce388]|uniref:hypothetical protein n=1 Tax=Sorangium sp. So ce388 TaxID=3133309 RepID=UPI003F5BA5DF